MKKIIKKFLIATAITALSSSFAFAQWDNVDYGGFNDNSSNSNYDSGYVDYNPYTPVNYNDVDYGGWSNSSTNYTDYSCIGCNGSYGNDSGYVDYNPYTPVNYNDVDYGGWSNSSTNYTDYSCIGCNSGSTYTSPSYSNYTSPSYSNYTSPSYSNYTSPSYSNYTSPSYSNYTSPSYTYTNNVSGNVVTNIVCPVGTLVNGQCINTVTGRVITTTTCPLGTVVNGSTCVNTVNGNVVTNIVCPTGTTLTNGQCVNTITPPVTTVTNCPSNTQYVNGTCQQTINPPVVVNQTCWNGAVIPATSVCAPQYKVCSNGVSVPVNQSCYVTQTTPQIVVPQVVKFNNVVTSIATQITNTSGRCNGIGLIANNAPSTGWFEYGDTPNLGKTTASASIGSAATSPFSNVLAGLRPNAKYYCRAVMQNQYGIVKGEIVSFVTSTAVYVKPTYTPVSTPVKKPAVITCSDGSILTVDNKTVTTMINKGEKLVAVQIEKVQGNLSSGSNVVYKISYKNLVDARLTGFVVKVTIPQEVLFASSNAGVYDPNTRTLTLNQDTIDPYTEGSIIINGVVMNDAPLGKTIVTNVYAAYTVPTTHAQDEVTAYVVGSIVPVVDTINKDTGAKNVIGANGGKSFMPNSLIEWLALIAILFIIFILGRSIYASYKEDETSKHH